MFDIYTLFVLMPFSATLDIKVAHLKRQRKQTEGGVMCHIKRWRFLHTCDPVLLWWCTDCVLLSWCMVQQVFYVSIMVKHGYRSCPTLLLWRCMYSACVLLWSWWCPILATESVELEEIGISLLGQVYEKTSNKEYGHLWPPRLKLSITRIGKELVPFVSG